MKIKVPVTRSLIGIIKGTYVNDVVSVKTFGRATPSVIVSKYPGYTCLQQKKCHVVFEVPENEFLDFLNEKGKEFKKNEEE